MFVPPFQAIEASLPAQERLDKASGNVVIRGDLLRLLFSCVLAMSEFDEAAYLRAYPDVAAAIEAGIFPTGFAHFAEVGYFAGRFIGATAFDEGWYLSQFPDVAEAVRSGDFISGWDHYAKLGIREWRAPNAGAVDDLRIWQEALLGLRVKRAT